MDALAILQRLAGGNLIREVVDALATTAEEVVATGKPGTVTLTLKVSTKNQGDPFVIVEETLARAAPKKDARGAYFFAVDGELHRDDPRQTRIDFRTVDRDTGEVRAAGDVAATVREVTP